MWMRWNDIDRLFNTMEMLQQTINRMNTGYRWHTLPRVWDVPQGAPNTNLYDTGNHLEMKIEVPGIAREDLSVKIQGNYLEISGTKKADTPSGYTAHRVERGASTFSRSFTLPVEVDTNKVEAHLANGLLTLILPKVETAKPKQITIS